MAKTKTPKYKAMAFFSVVIPTYNRIEFLKPSIDSVLNQTYRDFEIIVVDDGSTDKTTELLSTYGNKIQWESQSNNGVSSARNRGINLAKGQYIALLDSDDFWLPHKLEVQYKFLKSNRDIVFTWGGVVRSKNFINVISSENTGQYHYERLKYDLKDLLVHNKVCTSTVVFNRKYAIHLEGFDTKLSHGEDWDLWIRLASIGNISYLDNTLALYRVHQNQAVTNKKRLTIGELKVIEKNKSIFLALDGGEKFYNQQFAIRITAAALEAVKEKDYKVARRLALKGLLSLNKQAVSACMKVFLETLIGTYMYDTCSSLSKRVGRQ